MSAGPQPIPPQMQAVADRMNAWCEALTRVRPQPVTFRAEVVELVHDGRPEDAVQLWAITPGGPQVFHLPPALARELAGLLLESARVASCGLTIPAGMRGLPDDRRDD